MSKRGVLICLFWLLWALPLHAAITFDAVSSATANNVSSFSWNHTVSSGCTNAILAVDVGWHLGPPGTITSITYNGDALAGVVGVANPNSGTRTELWARVSPDAGGAFSVVVTLDGVKNSLVGVARSYCGVDQATPWGSSATATGDSVTTASVNVSSAVGELVIDAAHVTNLTLLVGAGQTERANLQEASNVRLGVSEEIGASSVTMSWTISSSDNYHELYAAPLKPATVGTGQQRRTVIFP